MPDPVNPTGVPPPGQTGSAQPPPPAQPSPDAQSMRAMWKQWLGPGATDQDVQQLFNNLCNMINTTIQQQLASSLKQLKKLRRIYEGGDAGDDS